jgi:nucleotide-binding universal stress UspA family protein
VTETTVPILLAVGAGDCEAALRFGVTEALRIHRGLHLVHVLHMPPSGPESFSIAFEAGREIGQRALDAASARAEELGAGQVEITTELVLEGHGTVHDLVERSTVAHLVVLQHRHRGLVARLGAGSATYGVAARAHVPVVSVPEGWVPPDEPFGTVTVGVHEPERAEEVLRTAFELAHENGSGLRVLHTWWLANGYDDGVVDDTMRRDFAARATEAITATVAPLRQEYPDVEASIDVRHVSTVDGLVEASRTSDLLVIGRRHVSLPWRSHLGSAARGTIRESACPVAVVEPNPIPMSAGQHEPRDPDLLR